MVFQDPPKPLHRIIFAMVGRVISQLYLHLLGIAELNQTMQPLPPVTAIFWPIIRIDQQRMRALIEGDLGPHFLDSVHHEIGGDFACGEPEMELR